MNSSSLVNFQNHPPVPAAACSCSPCPAFLQAAGLQLLADCVPAAWDALWEGPVFPADYVRTVVARAIAIEAWWAKSQVGGHQAAQRLGLPMLGKLSSLSKQCDVVG